MGQSYMGTLALWPSMPLRLTVGRGEGRIPVRAPFYDAAAAGQWVIDFPQFRNGRTAPAIATRYARRSTLFWIFPDIVPSFFKRTPPASPPAKLPTDPTSHKARMRFPWK